jgi:hypothetical protein
MAEIAGISRPLLGLTENRWPRVQCAEREGILFPSEIGGDKVVK